MTIVLKSKPGLSSATALSIPKTWDAVWFRNFINNMLKGADVRNAIGTNGVVVTGNISSPYATISLGSGTATSATAGTHGAVPAQVVGYVIVNIGGTNFKMPYFNT